MYTDDINKIAVSSNDDKRLQTFDWITSYPYGISARKVCKTKLLENKKWLTLMIILMEIKYLNWLNLKWPYTLDHLYIHPY